MTAHFGVLLGPTASGKTGLCRRLVGLPVELINADSIQMYRDLKVGAARPPQDLIDQIPHHLVGFLSLNEEFSCGDFARRANRLIGEICANGRWPLVVGGSPFYIRALLFGLPDIPAIASEIRAQLAPLSCEQLKERLEQVDPASAARIRPQDRQRLARALEVYQGCGRTLSSFVPPQRVRPDIHCQLWGLSWPREQLYHRIEQRLCQMMAEGLVQEWQDLLRQGGNADIPALKAIGYREFFTAPPGQDIKEIGTRIARNTRRLAKRQLTFYRHLPGINWLEPARHSLFPRLLKSFFTALPAASRR